MTDRTDEYATYKIFKENEECTCKDYCPKCGKVLPKPTFPPITVLSYPNYPYYCTGYASTEAGLK